MAGSNFCMYVAIIAITATISLVTCEHAKILILGAGTSGIQAAGTLSENGFTDFLVIEGADYVGGRVKNGQINGVTVGLGAQWTPTVDNADINNKILGEWNIGSTAVDFDSLVVRDSSTGLEVPTNIIGPVWDRLGAAQAKSVEIAQDILDNGKSDVSQRTALVEGGWIARTPVERTVEWFAYDFEASVPISVTSLLSTAFQNYEGLHYITDPRGYEAIFPAMAPYLYQNDTVFNNHIRLNQRVISIDYSNKDKVEVTCDDGNVYTGDYVLMTFSLGVLQNNSVQFIPELPNWKKSILSQFSTAAYTSIYLSFPERFWDNAETILNVDERYNYYPYFLNLDYHGTLPEDTHILSVHVVGNEARRIDFLSDEQIKGEIEEVLQKMYGLDTPPRATEILKQSWLRDPLHLSSYTNRPAEVQLDFLPKLQARVDRVFFGGEITGGVRGGLGDAYGSGTREATKMLRCIAGEECPEYQEAKPCKCEDVDGSKKQRKNCDVAVCYSSP